jgi:nucleoside-diphosphate-sugar epimerase
VNRLTDFGEQASDLSMTADPHAVIPRIVKGTLNALEAAEKQESIKRVVLTSSSAAAFISQPDVEGVRVDESTFCDFDCPNVISDTSIFPSDTWNDAAVEAAWDPSTPATELAYHVYAASKTQGEREAWDWVKKHKPHFDFNVVVPNTNVIKTESHSVALNLISLTDAYFDFTVWQNPLS